MAGLLVHHLLNLKLEVIGALVKNRVRNRQISEFNGLGQKRRGCVDKILHFEWIGKFFPQIFDRPQ